MAVLCTRVRFTKSFAREFTPVISIGMASRTRERMTRSLAGRYGMPSRRTLITASRPNITGSNTISPLRALSVAATVAAFWWGNSEGKIRLLPLHWPPPEMSGTDTREEKMQDQLASSLRELVIPPGVLEWLQEAVGESDLTQQVAREREIKRMEEQHRRIEAKLEAMYEDRLDGRITPEMYDRKTSELRSQAAELASRVSAVRAAAPAPVEEAIDVMDLTSRAADLFLIQPPQEKQRFLRLVLKSASWKGGELRTEFEEPFETLRRSNQLSVRKYGENGMGKAEIGVWLLR